MSVANCARSAIRAPGQDNFRNGRRARFGITGGFTLIELLVVIAVIAILAAILFPVFSSARDSGKRARCSVQLKQLLSAAQMYADDNSGRYVPAARDVWESGGGLERWHGSRESVFQDFDPRKGPLWTYMARSGGLKQCPGVPLKGSRDFEGSYDVVAFEAGCGGYGYNKDYVGGTYYRNHGPDAARLASLTSDIYSPSKTVMFADTAMARRDPATKRTVLIEYSFAEPPSGFASPSIHFRHNGCASVGWCDGHVSAEKMTFTREGNNAYEANSRKHDLGWFGSNDKSLFDNK